MNNSESWQWKSALLDFFRGHQYEPQTTEQLAKSLGVGESQLDSFEQGLIKLQRSGLAAHLHGRGWFSPRREGWIVGQLQVSRKGFGWVSPSRDVQSSIKEASIYISRSKLKDAHDGDLVLVKLKKARDRGKAASHGRDPDSRQGRILYVLQRSPRIIRGLFYAGHDTGVVESLKSDSLREIWIGVGKTGGAKDGQTVLVRLSNEAPVRGMPQGEVLAIASAIPSYSEDLEVVLSEFELPRDFGEEVMDEAELISAELESAELAQREDYRQSLIFTIDPHDARDFDDAITIRQLGNGNFELGVFIADVAHYVRAGSAIDREAIYRGNSIYLPGRVIPMLPEKLSNNLCSLRPGVDRFVKSVWMTISPSGRLLSKRVTRGVICSKHRFAYEEVQEVLEGRALSPAVSPEIEAMLLLMNEARQILQHARSERGGLDLEIESRRLVLDDDGNIEEIGVDRRDSAHRLVEEFMLLANEAVAEIASEREIPILRRVHPEPPQEDIDSFVEFCNAVVPGVRIQGLEDCPQVLERVRGQSLAPVVNFALLRALTRASYQPDPGIHYALAKEDYCHFTSPIRRYADLQVHRVLDAKLFGIDQGAANEEQLQNLVELGEQCSARERLADDAERELSKMRVIAWLKPREGECFRGVITAVFEFGFFVRLADVFAEGIVHVSTLGRDFFEFDEKRYCLHGRQSGLSFAMGDEVEVKLLQADVLHRQLELRWQDPSSHKQGFERSGRGAAKSARRSGVHSSGAKEGSGGKRKRSDQASRRKRRR